MRVGGAAAATLVAGLALAAAGCTPAGDGVDFRAPIVWSGGHSSGSGESAVERAETEVALEADGVATVRELPTGISVQWDGAWCLEVGTAPSYSGEATWRVVDRMLELTWAGSTLRLGQAGGGFGSQDWTELVLVECDSGERWQIDYLCGDSGYGGRDDADGPFREDCEG